MTDEYENDIRKKLQEDLKELSKFPAEERINIYEQLSDFVPLNGCFIGLRHFRRKNVEVSKDGIVINRKPHVFLSHSHKDKKLARRIYRQLTDDGLTVWFDEAELRFGDSLISKLSGAIETVDILLAMISENSIESDWVKKEIEIAMNQEICSKCLKVIPLLCDPVGLPGFLIGKFYADFQTPALRKRNLPKLVSDIKAHLNDMG